MIEIGLIPSPSHLPTFIIMKYIINYNHSMLHVRIIVKKYEARFKDDSRGQYFEFAGQSHWSQLLNRTSYLDYPFT